jgi:hypothetical protein
MCETIINLCTRIVPTQEQPRVTRRKSPW